LPKSPKVAFLITVYRNERLPLRERMAAAMAVSPYERVRLTAVDMRIRDANGNSGWNPDWTDEKAGEKLIHAIERQIEVHQQEEHEAMIEKAKAGFASIKQDSIFASRTFCRLRQLRRHPMAYKGKRRLRPYRQAGAVCFNTARRSRSKRACPLPLGRSPCVIPV
jgi:hypothetical protein